MATIFSDPDISAFDRRRKSGWSDMIYPSVNSRFLVPIIFCVCPEMGSMRTCSSIKIRQPCIDLVFILSKMGVSFTFLQLLVLSPELHNNLSKMKENIVGCLFQQLGWSLLDPKDFCGSNHSTVGLYVHCQPAFHISMHDVRHM